MSAVAVIRSVLAGDVAVTSKVPASRIVIGVVGQAITLPAIGITSVSATPRNTLSMAEAQRLTTERVQVTVFASTYPVLDDVCKRVRAVVTNRRQTIATLKVQAILPDNIGPDMQTINPLIYMRTLDFKVFYL